MGLTTRQLREKTKEHNPMSIENFFLSEKKDNIRIKVLNGSKCQSIAERFVNNPTCGNGYKLKRFEIIKNCSNFFD